MTGSNLDSSSAGGLGIICKRSVEVFEGLSLELGPPILDGTMGEAQTAKLSKELPP